MWRRKKRMHRRRRMMRRRKRTRRRRRRRRRKRRMKVSEAAGRLSCDRESVVRWVGMRGVVGFGWEGLPVSRGRRLEAVAALPVFPSSVCTARDLTSDWYAGDALGEAYRG